MGSMLVAVIPSKSTKNMRRIPNPFSQPRLAISNPESRLFTPIKATWDILPEVWRLWALNKACDGFTHWGWSTVLAGTTCFGSLLEYLREPARTRTDKRRRRDYVGLSKIHIYGKVARTAVSIAPLQYQFQEAFVAVFLQEFTFQKWFLMVFPRISSSLFTPNDFVQLTN